MTERKNQRQQQPELHGAVLSGGGSPTLWGALIGPVTFYVKHLPEIVNGDLSENVLETYCAKMKK